MFSIAEVRAPGTIAGEIHWVHPMHVAVLGAGVVGVTTAYYLAESGHSVTIVDRAPGVASATSHANGAQLSYSYTDSLARPEFVPKIPSLILGMDPAIRVRMLGNFGLYPWGVHFLAQCTNSKARENTIAVLEIALRSARLIAELQDRVGLEFSYRKAGKLVVLGDDEAVAAARERRDLKIRHGCITEILSRDEAFDLEPALAAMRQEFAGAVYSEHDEVGDAEAFSAGLAAWLQVSRGVTLSLGTEVTGLRHAGGRLAAIRTTGGDLDCDAAVVCLGPWSQAFLRPLGIDPLIYPVRGYSVTLPPGPGAPAVSVTNIKRRIVYSRIKGYVRIAGFADFLGFDTRHDDKRVALLLKVAEELAPEAADYGGTDKQAWGGFRPVTPSSRPVVGASRVPGLYLNVGHGVLGWTLACATAQDVATTIGTV